MQQRRTKHGAISRPQVEHRHEHCRCTRSGRHRRCRARLHRRHGGQRFIITAAHCLPELPPPGSNSYTGTWTYGHLLARLNSPPSILAECLFVDPVADLAVLSSPDNQEFFDEADAFDDLVDSVTALNIAAAKDGEAWMLSLEGVWAPCVLRVPAAAHWMGSIHVENFQSGIDVGMSGSPIISPTGETVGAICSATVTGPSDLDKGAQWL